MREYTITSNEAGQRFDKYLFKLLKKAPTGLIFKQLRNKNITLNNKKAKGSEQLKENDTVKIFMSDETIDNFIGNNIQTAFSSGIKLNVVYEDENVIIADKPVGILSQKAGAKDVSMNEILLEYLISCGMKKSELITFKPAFCNRLDRNTSGLMIAGKTLKGLQTMSELIRNRTVRKFYLTIVSGNITNGRKLEGYLVKNPDNTVSVSKEQTENSDYINTVYEPLANDKGLTLLKIELITGKPHQIRAHLAFIGHPVLGDPKYGNIHLNRQYKEKYQLLHSYELQFPEMDRNFCALSNKVITAAYPAGFEKYFKPENIKWQNQEA